jgi:hypothetical protein
MEDFIGRGDRRIAKVIRRAWELGALNDAWWEGEAKAAATWNQVCGGGGGCGYGCGCGCGLVCMGVWGV